MPAASLRSITFTFAQSIDPNDRGSQKRRRRRNLAREERIFTLCDGTIDLVSAFFNVSSKEVRFLGRIGRADVAKVRQIAMYVAHVALHLSMAEVARGFGKDRTTVVHACHSIEDLREDPEFDRVVQTVERIVTVSFNSREDV